MMTMCDPQSMRKWIHRKSICTEICIKIKPFCAGHKIERRKMVSENCEKR